jgi:type I restriction enzyme S subunit
MADLTSLHRNKPKRDFSIQACADCLNKIAFQFPMEFKESFFTDYFDIAGGTQPPKSTFINEPREGYIKFLQIRDFSSDSTPTFIPISKNNKLCNEDDLVLGRYGASVGKILTGKSGAYNVACAKIIFLGNKEIDKDFLFYWLHSSYFQNFLTSISRSAQGGFNKNDLSRIKTYFPSIAVQRNLTSILKSIDTALINGDKIVFNKKDKNNIEVSFIELVEKFLSFINEGEELSTEFTFQLNNVKKLRQQLLQDAVQGKLVEQNLKDEPASGLLNKIKSEKIKLIAEKKLKKEKELPSIKPDEIPFDIPENWVWCRLGEICTKITDGFHNTPPKVSEGIPYIAATQVKSDKIDWENCNYVEEKYHRELFVKAYPQKGELLVVNIGAGCGTPAIIDVDFEFSFKNTAILKFNQNLISNKLLFYYFLLRKEEIYAELTKGGLQPFLSLKILNEIDFPLPPIEEQNRIVQKIDELMQYCNELEESIKQSESKNEKLLQQVLREALRKEPVEV